MNTSKRNHNKKPKNSNQQELPEGMSTEDCQLHDDLAMLVARANESPDDLAMTALETIRDLIRSSTTSMTSAPKPLKFMRRHFDTMKDVYRKLQSHEIRSFCADIISVLAMVMGSDLDCLTYRLLCYAKQPIGDWGHEYVHHLAGEICTRWPETSGNPRERLLDLVKQIVPYDMEHNAEIEACDLLMEIDRLDLLEGFVNEDTFSRVCLYFQNCVAYASDTEYLTILNVLISLSCKFNRYSLAIQLALKQLGPNSQEAIKKIFQECPDSAIRKQLAFILARQHKCIEPPSMLTAEESLQLTDIMSNAHTSKFFVDLARELDIMEPKTPDDVYKSKLNSAVANFPVSSALQNLAASFVNAFVNAGFGVDKLLTQDGKSWVYANKKYGMLSATASLGLIMLWDVDKGLAFIDKYFYSADEFIVGGSLLACGIVNCGMPSEEDPAYALLSDYVNDGNLPARIGAILGLGIAYAGTNDARVIETLHTVFHPDAINISSNSEVLGLTALSLGLIAVAACNDTVSEILLNTILREDNLPVASACFLTLGLGMLYLGCRDAAGNVISALKRKLAEPFKTMAVTMMEICAYAGTGNVLKIQRLLHICSEHYDERKEDGKQISSKDLSSTQSLGVLGIALIAMGEEIGVEMAYRSLGNLMRYSESCIRRAVPLALGLISVSNPRPKIVDALTKYSHDTDVLVAHNAMFAMGLVGAGTNNARLAATLRQLTLYYAKDPHNLFMVRIAQGLTHLGKGTLTLNPFHSDRQLMDPVAVAGLLATLVACIDDKNLIMGSSHYLLYVLVPAVQPRMLITVDEYLQQLNIPVRIGIAIDVVGQAGKPKTITGFQTHITPVLLATGERAELATDEYIALTEVMEGIVILRKNPNFVK